VLCAPVSIGARSAGGRVGTDGVDEDALVADGAGVGAGEVEREEGGEPTEGQGWVIVVRGTEGEGVVGTAVGAGRAGAGVKHGGSLCVSAQESPGAASGGTGKARIVDEEGCWENYSRRGWVPSGCDKRAIEVRAMRRREGRRRVTRLATLAAR